MKRIYPDLQKELELLTDSLEEVEPKPITIALVLTIEDEDKDELPKILETCVRTAQLSDKTCFRVIKKL